MREPKGVAKMETPSHHPNAILRAGSRSGKAEAVLADHQMVVTSQLFGVLKEIKEVEDMKEVIVRPGMNVYKYSVYTVGGGFIFNADSMKVIRDCYRYELRHGLLTIRKERSKSE